MEPGSVERLVAELSEQVRRRFYGKYRGIGICNYTEVSGTGAPGWRVRGFAKMPGFDSSRVVIEPDGRITVYVSQADSGQGHYTTFAQIAADRLGASCSDVTVVAIGGMVPRALQAAEQLAEEGIAVEVVDPRTLLSFEDAIAGNATFVRLSRLLRSAKGVGPILAATLIADGLCVPNRPTEWLTIRLPD